MMLFRLMVWMMARAAWRAHLRWRGGRVIGRGAALALLCVTALLFGGVPSAQAAETIRLPFAAGTAVRIIQGYHGGSHQGRSRYGLDLVLADGGTAGAAVLAPVSGRFAWSGAPGAGNGCLTISFDDGQYSVMLCHVILDRAFARGEAIAQGQRLGTVGRAGTVGNNGTPHVHLELHRGARGSNPVPFSAPDGLPLEGVNFPASGAANEHAGRTRYVSSNSAEERTAPAEPAPGGTSAPPRAGGVPATVSGTDSCLNVRAAAGLGAPVLKCLPDGTSVTIVGDAVEADGYTWRQLDGLGWAVTRYLRLS